MEEIKILHRDEVAEWLRRWTANPMGSARVGSNPILVEYFFTTSHFTHADGGRHERHKTCLTFKSSGEWGWMIVGETFNRKRKEKSLEKNWPKGFRYRESNPGLLGESQLS